MSKLSIRLRYIEYMFIARVFKDTTLQLIQLFLGAFYDLEQSICKTWTIFLLIKLLPHVLFAITTV